MEAMIGLDGQVAASMRRRCGEKKLGEQHIMRRLVLLGLVSTPLFRVQPGLPRCTEIVVVSRPISAAQEDGSWTHRKA
jgi:hypothetical protein